MHSSASYAGWLHTIGGIVENAGFTTFQANRTEPPPTKVEGFSVFGAPSAQSYILFRLKSEVSNQLVETEPPPTKVEGFSVFGAPSAQSYILFRLKSEVSNQLVENEIEKLAAAGEEDPIEDLITAWYDAANKPEQSDFALNMVVGGDTGLIAIASANEITFPVRKNAQATDAYDYNPTEFGKFMTNYTDRYFAVSDNLEVKLENGVRTKNAQNEKKGRNWCRRV